MMLSIHDMPPGYYKHYKGGLYRVLFPCKLEATGEDMVVYESADGATIWTRPFAEFREKFAPAQPEPTVLMCTLGTAADADRLVEEAEKYRRFALQANTVADAEYWTRRADACIANAIAAAS